MAINDDIHHTDMNWVGILCYQISPFPAPFHFQSDNSQVKLYNDSAYTAIDAEGKAEMKFIARYVATNATVTAGTANADSQFTVEYKK